jgi:hypothetical protein
MFAEAVRPSIFTPAVPGAIYNYQCVTELPVVQGNVQTLFQDCACSTAAVTLRWSHQSLVGTVACGPVTSTFSPLPLPGTPFPTGFMSFSVGAWTCGAAAGIPPRELWVDFGVLQYADPCVGGLPFHIVTGVTTRNPPSMLFSPVAPITTVFMDLQNVLLLNPNLTVTPGWGRLFLSTEVWNLNLP